MPNVEVMNLLQKAVLWERSAVDRYGEPTVSDPVEIDVRWEEGLQETIDAEGTPVAASGTVDVDQDIPVGSILWLGELADLPDPVTSGLVEVVSSDKVPDIKGRVYARSVTVRKWRASLPTIV